MIGLQCRIILSFVIVVFSASMVAAETTWEGSDDFSIRSNPNGAWSYGWMDNESSLFVPFAIVDTGDPGGFPEGIAAWHHDLGSSAINPSVSKNVTDELVNWSGIMYSPGQLAFHPGPDGERGVPRWTAATSGTVRVSAQLRAMHECTTGVRVIVSYGDENVLLDDILAYDELVCVETVLKVDAGTMVDLLVDAAGPYNCDTTAINVRISACAADLDHNGQVDTSDLLAILLAWGECGCDCAADIDADGTVATSDLLSLLISWGPCE